MAARWGTGEEMFKACNTTIFSSMNVDEAEVLQGSFPGDCLEYHSLNNAGALETLHGCLDPSILSIFEDSPTEEVKSSIDEESEVTLLTALTEILDNVDDDNLSPFDTLPDSELFSGQKVQENSPLRKFLSQSPIEKESLIHTRQFPGKSLPRLQRASQQNSEGEEEDGDASFSTPISIIDSSSLDGFDWCLPVSLEQDGDNMPITLGDFVKHMHPYCMTLCTQGEEGQEHLLSEGGIVLEVVDQRENGEHVLAIPDFSLSPPQTNPAEGEQRVPEKSIDDPEPKEKSRDVSEKSSIPADVSSVEKKVIEKEVVNLHKKEPSDICHLKRNKKQKNVKTRLVKPRVLRSSSTRTKDLPQKKQKKQKQDEQKKKVKFFAACSHTDPGRQRPEQSTGLIASETQVEKEQILTLHANARITDLKPVEKPLPSVLPSEESIETELPSKQELVGEQPVVCQNSETKPKSLSLQQYRVLRQQKKPEPVDKPEDHSTKWPKLPEAPKELPPIPCLPEPNPRDPRRTLPPPVRKDLMSDIMPAWHPRGPAAPPTPEALLVPPSSMMASTKRPCSKSALPTSGTSVDRSSQTPQPSISTPPQEQLTESSPPAIHFSSLNASQSPPTPTRVPHNTIQNVSSQPARSTTSGASHSLHVPSDKECSIRNSSAAHVVEEMPVVPSKVSEPSRPQAVTKNSATTQVKDSPPQKPSAAVPVTRKTTCSVLASVPDQARNTLSNSKKLTAQPHIAPIAAQPFISAQVQAKVVELAEQIRMASSDNLKPKNGTVQLIESFTSEIGIEASDLTSLLEQFEESQSKEEQSVPEVCGRAAAVGNSGSEHLVETKALEKTKSHDLGSTAGLTPPATPPHQMWKPLAPVALLGKTRKSELLKPTSNKAIQIEARPLPSNKLRCKPQIITTTGQPQAFCRDHDYCLPPKEPNQNEVGNRWNVKQQPSIVIKTVELSSNKTVWNSVPTTPSVVEGTQRNLSQLSADRKCSEKDALNSSVLVTPDASPNRPNSESPLPSEAKSHQLKSLSYSESSSRQYQQKRGRSRRRYRGRSSSSSESSSMSSSRSRSPPSKRYRSRHPSSKSRSPSRSCSRSSSRSYSPPRRHRYSYLSSRSRSSSCSRSRSRSSDSHGRRDWKRYRSPNRRSRNHCSQSQNEDLRRRKEKAIEERRIVYVGRIHGNMTRKELKERFSSFGKIEECTVHFRENGDNYGFVTYYNTKDAFDAIENGSKIREPNELPFDLCFGGRRQFCKANYADLDSNREYDATPMKGKFDALDFDTLLKQAQTNLKKR